MTILISDVVDDGVTTVDFTAIGCLSVWLHIVGERFVFRDHLVVCLHILEVTYGTLSNRGCDDLVRNLCQPCRFISLLNHTLTGVVGNADRWSDSYQIW